ncbi:hypothetical protein TNCV_153981 [Trichonephila clavipes]|nr:hypothetical protein TNCV_153981 [Trichonephila clavipes]
MPSTDELKQTTHQNQWRNVHPRKPHIEGDPRPMPGSGFVALFGGSRRPSCKKMPADESVVTEMEEEHLFQTTNDVEGAPSCINTMVVAHRLV